MPVKSRTSNGKFHTIPVPPPPSPSPLRAAPPPPPPQAVVPSLGRTMMEGIAFGAGTSIAKETINTLFSKNTSTEPEPVKPPIPPTRTDICEKLLQELDHCMMYQTTCDGIFEKYVVQCSNLRNQAPN